MDVWRPEINETHISVVLLLGDHALKLKKPVALGFIDQSTVDARRSACEREVALNRRFAPDVYLGVGELSGPDGLAEPLVVMRRLPVDRRLATLVTSDEDLEPVLDEVVRIVSGVHAASPSRAAWDRTATASAVAARWEAGFVQLASLDVTLDRAAVRRVEDLARAYLAGRAPLFEHRIADRCIRDGHGDLLAEDIFCLPDGPRILDCLEFDEDLRVGDVLADIGFLAMDLERLGRPDLATLLLDRYRTTSGATWPASLEHHYLGYRAHVRCKVRALAAAQGVAGAAEDAAALLELASSHLESGRIRLILVGGLPATGKSTLAHAVRADLPATILRADVVRKELAGLAPDDHRPAAYGEGLYAAEHTDRTYRTLLERARASLGQGRSVIVDGSWSSAAWRTRARQVAEETASELVELRCVCPPSLAVARMHGQDRRIGPSDATPEVAARMAADFDDWPEARTVDPTQGIAGCVAEVMDAVRQAALPTLSRTA